MDLISRDNFELIWVHEEKDCVGPPCCVHSPSNHALNRAPLHFRNDRRIMERTCEHGIGHPDPDDLRVRFRFDSGIHSCDGCCQGPRVDSTIAVAPSPDEDE